MPAPDRLRPPPRPARPRPAIHRSVSYHSPSRRPFWSAAPDEQSSIVRLHREVIVLTGPQSCFLNNLAIYERACCYFYAKAACSDIKSHAADAGTCAAILRRLTLEKLLTSQPIVSKSERSGTGVDMANLSKAVCHGESDKCRFGNPPQESNFQRLGIRASLSRPRRGSRGSPSPT